MAHGMPDYGIGAPMSGIFALPDMAELARRLGVPISIDGLGNVIWMEDFENGIERWEGMIGVGMGSKAWSPTISQDGKFSMKFTTGTVDGQQMGAYAQMPYPYMSKTGLEVHLSDAADLLYIYSTLEIFNGTTYYKFGVRWDLANTKLQYFNSAEGWTNFASDVLQQRTKINFAKCKVVADFNTGKYVRVRWNEKTYDLSTISGFTSASAVPPMIRVSLNTNSLGTDSIVSYFDNVIVTQNEP